MENLLEMLKKRTPPGVIILDLDDRLCFVNREAVAMIPSLAGPAREMAAAAQSVSGEIRRACRILKACAEDGTEPTWPIVATPAGSACTLKAFFIDGPVGEGRPSHILVLVERIAERREADFARAQREFELSNRETEVLKFLCGGLSNREISERMFICEYTVKDHVKRIMRKMGLRSRSKVVACFR